MIKKFVSAFLITALCVSLASCGKRNISVSDSDKATSENNVVSEWAPEVPQQEELQRKDCMCGVYYMNYSLVDFSGQKKTRNDYNAVFKQSGGIKKFPFLKDIPDENIVSTPMGTEIYLIIPTDPNARVDVYLLAFDEALFTTVRSDQPIYSSGNGKPIVLQCNYGDLFSDAQLVISDSNGEELVWSPSISLRDGTVYTKTDDGKKIYDFTEYDDDFGEAMDD